MISWRSQGLKQAGQWQQNVLVVAGAKVFFIYLVALPYRL